MRSFEANAKALLLAGLVMPGLAPAAEAASARDAAFASVGAAVMHAGNGALSAAVQSGPSSAEIGAGNVIAAELLDDFRGGTEVFTNEIVTNTAQTTGTVQDNSAVNVVSGWNAITGGAFANASGLPIVIQNSGANVLIQNSTIVNVQFK